MFDKVQEKGAINAGTTELDQRWKNINNIGSREIELGARTHKVSWAGFH